MTSKDSPRFIGLPVEESGLSPPAWQAGPTLDLFGQPPAHAKAKASPASVLATKTQGICGPTYFESSAPPVTPGGDLLSSWENRLRLRLARIGSTESPLIWRTKATPSGRLISRLAPWTPPIDASASTGAPWPTPTVRDEKSPLRNKPNDPRRSQLNDKMAAQWPTPNCPSGGRKLTLEEAITQRKRKDGSKAQLNLENAMVHLAAHWVTPSSLDWKDTPGMSATGENPDGSTRQRMDQLPRQMAATEVGGLAPTGLNATTEKRGVPNPVFAFWLQAFPAEWISGALRAMQSMPRSRRKSSAR